RELDALDAHGASTLAREPLELRALAVAGVGDDEDVDVVAMHVDGHDLVVVAQAHADHALGSPARRAHRLLAETNRLAMARDDEDVVGAAGLYHPHQLVAVFEVDGDEALAPALVVLAEHRLLDLPLEGGEEQVAVV